MLERKDIHAQEVCGFFMLGHSGRLQSIPMRKQQEVNRSETTGHRQTHTNAHARAHTRTKRTRKNIFPHHKNEKIMAGIKMVNKILFNMMIMCGNKLGMDPREYKTNFFESQRGRLSRMWLINDGHWGKGWGTCLKNMTSMLILRKTISRWWVHSSGQWVD